MKLLLCATGLAAVLSLVPALADTPAVAQSTPAAGTTPAAAPALVAQDQTAPSAPQPPPPPAAAATPANTVLGGFLSDVQATGFVDWYYSYNFNGPASKLNTFRNFDFRDNSFSINLAELMLLRPPDPKMPVGFKLKLGFGDTAEFVSGQVAFTNFTPANPPASPAPAFAAFTPLGAGASFDTPTLRNVMEAYASVLLGGKKNITLDAGKFVTSAGEEVIETKDNFNYTRSLLFSYAIPFYHAGLRITYPVSPKLTLQASAVNGWNDVVDNNRDKTFGFQANWTPSSQWNLIHTFYAGPEKPNNNHDYRYLWDTVLTYTPSPKKGLFTYVLNHDYAQEDNDPAAGQPGTLGAWRGLAAYVHYTPNKWHAYTIRGEFFDDPKGVTTGVPGNKLREVTLTYELTGPGNLITRFEYRHDWANLKEFENHGTGSSTQDTLLVGQVFKF